MNSNAILIRDNKFTFNCPHCKRKSEIAVNKHKHNFSIKCSCDTIVPLQLCFRSTLRKQCNIDASLIINNIKYPVYLTNISKVGYRLYIANNIKVCKLLDDNTITNIELIWNIPNKIQFEVTDTIQVKNKEYVEYGCYIGVKVISEQTYLQNKNKGFYLL